MAFECILKPKMHYVNQIGYLLEYNHIHVSKHKYLDFTHKKQYECWEATQDSKTKINNCLEAT